MTLSLLGAVSGTLMLGLILALVYGGMERWGGQAKLKATREKLEKEGILQPIEKILPPPSAEALANGTRLLDSLKELKEIGAAHTVYRIVPNGMKMTAPGVAVSLAAQAKPEFAGTEKDQPPQSWEEFRREVDEVAPLLEEARKILQQPMALKYEVENGKPRPSDDMARLRELCAWLKADAMIKLHDRDIPGVLDDIEAIQKVARAVAAAPSVVRGILGFAMEIMGTGSLFWEVLQDNNLSMADLNRLQELVSSVDYIALGMRGLQIHIATIPDGYKIIANSLSQPATWMMIENPEGILGEKRMIEARDFLWPHLWAEGDQARALADLAKSDALAREFVANKNWSEVSPRLKESEWPATTYEAWRFPFASSLSGTEVTRSMFESMVKGEIRRQFLLAAIGIRKYRIENGRLPASLAELAPTYLPVSPWDWFDGKPLKYRKEGDAFVLYSVGKDGVDDGAHAGEAQKMDDLRMDSGRDVVWPQAARD